MNPSPNQPNFDVDVFTEAAKNYYNTIKPELEEKNRGKYVAIDSEYQKYWIGETATEALEKAKKALPDRIFYVLLVGSPSTFVVQSIKSSSLAF